MSGEKNRNNEKKLEAFEKNYQSNIEALENRINKMNKAVTVADKDTLISAFEKVIEEINLKLEKQHFERKIEKPIYIYQIRSEVSMPCL